MPRFWDKPQTLGPSAGLVQQHYVDQRIAELKRKSPDIENEIRTSLEKYLPGVDLSGDKLMTAYFKLQAGLQSADLTINFKGPAMFGEPCNYQSYRQAYDLSADQRGKGVLPVKWGSDTAAERSAADDKVTFPGNWNQKGPAVPQRGLRPGVQSRDRIRNQMAFGGHSVHAVQADPFAADFAKTTEIKSTNSHFNPKTKQIFAALNYGRWQWGGADSYGKCHFVLNRKFKMNAVFYGGDTYTVGSHNGDFGVAYSHLGAILARTYSGWDGGNHVIKSCYHNQRLPACPPLLEGHIFSDLPFKGNIERVVILAKVGSNVHKNAKTFAARVGAKLVTLSPHLLTGYDDF